MLSGWTKRIAIAQDSLQQANSEILPDAGQIIQLTTSPEIELSDTKLNLMRIPASFCRS